ncbi:MAG: CvpA family protein [Patescibacteria group bacterium]|nr:CvpA family protein [Patescibacteria group bacterium]
MFTPYLPTINNIFNAVSVPSIGLNFFDIIILIIFIFYAIEGYSIGFFSSLFDLTSFILSFVLALKFYSLIGKLLVNFFHIPQGFADAGGFFIVFIFLDIIVNIILKKKILNRFPVKLIHNKASHILGVIPAIFSAGILVSFILTLIISLPFSAFLKESVSSSKIGNLLVLNTAGFEKKLNEVFGGAVSETLNFLTIEPESNESVSLNFKIKNFKVDKTSEKQMLALINKERTNRGLNQLIFDDNIAEVARAHAEDMFKKGYFSHYSQNGASPFDRLSNANIDFTYAGENLALAPSTEFAMQGLMNSKSHKDNILSPNFNKIGIGTIDGGIYGKMFVQEFTN